MAKTTFISRDNKTNLTIMECASGSWLAYFDNGTINIETGARIIANGNTVEDALKNLNAMLAAILNDAYFVFIEEQNWINIEPTLKRKL